MKYFLLRKKFNYLIHNIYAINPRFKVKLKLENYPTIFLFRYYYIDSQENKKYARWNIFFYFVALLIQKFYI